MGSGSYCSAPCRQLVLWIRIRSSNYAIVNSWILSPRPWGMSEPGKLLQHWCSGAGHDPPQFGLTCTASVRWELCDVAPYVRGVSQARPGEVSDLRVLVYAQSWCATNLRSLSKATSLIEHLKENSVERTPSALIVSYDVNEWSVATWRSQSVLRSSWNRQACFDRVQTQ